MLEYFHKPPEQVADRKLLEQYKDKPDITHEERRKRREAQIRVGRYQSQFRQRLWVRARLAAAALGMSFIDHL